MLNGPKALKMAVVALAPAIALTLAACNDNKKAATPAPAPQPQAIGAIEVDSASAAATVIMINSASRQVTLKWDDGQVRTYTLGKAAINFDQIKAGDRVKATVAESVAVFIGPGNLPPGAGEGTTVALAPKGAMPGGVIANTVVVRDRISAVDLANRTVTLEGISGTPQTIKVGPSVDISALKKGDDVTLRLTEAIALWVQRP